MPSRPRRWSYWTRAKLEILEDYLNRFTTASKSVSERVYLDAFAGEGIGVDRLTSEEFAGSVRIALQTSDPPFTKIRLFEQPAKAARLQRVLQTDYPDRDIRVYPGDCNVEIPRALAELSDVAWAPTFAFLDPDGMELAWETVEALARHRTGSQNLRVELWLLFNDMGLLRTLALNEELPERAAARATRLFGTEKWRRIYELRRDSVSSVGGWEARRGYLNLLRWRLKDLGYRWTMPLEFRNLQNRPMYEMIFATAHEAGERIMRSIYGRAEVQLDAKREDALALARGEPRLFPLDDLGVEPREYEYLEPFPPNQFPETVL